MMRRILGFVLVLSALLLAGCTAGPKYKRPALDVPGGYRGAPPETQKAAPEPTQEGSTAPAVQQSLGEAKWWTVFQDEELQKLIRTALQQNYDVRIAAERVLAAEAQLGITRADQLPSVSAGGGITSVRQAETAMSPTYRMDAGQLSAGASWELDFWGKYRKATEAARANLAASEWGRRVVISSLVSNVASAYFQLRALDMELDITQQTLKSRQESLRLTKILADGGATSMADVRQAEQLVYTASAAIPSLQSAIQQQENYISTLLGENPGPIKRGRSLAEQPRMPEVPSGLPSALIERRPDIRQAEEQLIAANAQIGVAKASFFPSIALTGTGGFQSTALTSLISGPAGLWTAAASLSQPIFTGGRLKNNLKLTEAEERQSVLVYQQSVQQAFRDVSDSLVAYQKTREAREQHERLVTAAQDASHLAQVRYEGGRAAYLEVLTNETNYYSAELSLVQSRLDEMQSLVQIYKALGGGWE